MRKVVVAALLLSVASQGSAQSFLNKANDLLGRVNGTMRGAAGGQTSHSVPSVINQQTPEQQAGQTQALATPLQAQISADRADAKPLIERLVMTSACARDSGAWNSFNRQLENPATFFNGLYMMVPMSWMPYHPKTKCLDVIRVVGWQKPAKNALNFRVYLISAQSDESKHQDFALVKSDDSGWLVRTIGDASN